MTGKLETLAAWRVNGGSSRRSYWNLVTATRRLERRLHNSMAHTPRPRAADLARWRAMQADLDAKREAIVQLDLELGHNA
jgi:hypothetical protein